MDNYPQVIENVHQIAKTCGRDSAEIKIIAVSKNHSLESILSVYKNGERDFGENRVQEALEKIANLPLDIQWHFIGILQKNKVAKVVGRFTLIHSVDSLEIAQKISEVSARERIVTPILLQVNTSGEISKHGLSPESWQRAMDFLQSLSHVSLQGLMTLAPLTEDKRIVRETFSKLRIFKETLLPQIDNKNEFMHLSMGMSHDYPIAIEEGATILRIGTEIFGKRA